MPRPLAAWRARCGTDSRGIGGLVGASVLGDAVAQVTGGGCVVRHDARQRLRPGLAFSAILTLVFAGTASDRSARDSRFRRGMTGALLDGCARTGTRGNSDARGGRGETGRTGGQAAASSAMTAAQRSWHERRRAASEARSPRCCSGRSYWRCSAKAGQQRAADVKLPNSRRGEERCLTPRRSCSIRVFLSRLVRWLAASPSVSRMARDLRRGPPGGGQRRGEAAVGRDRAALFAQQRVDEVALPVDRALAGAPAPMHRAVGQERGEARLPVADGLVGAGKPPFEEHRRAAARAP